MWIILLIGTIIFVYLQQSGWLYILKRTYKRDLSALKRFGTLNITLWIWQQRQMTVAKKFLQNAKRHPDKIAFRFEDDIWTFSQVDEFSNRVANYFKQQGYVRGDTVALYMESRPEYACIWLGFTKIGVVTALINSNLVSDPFLHSVKAAHSKALIFGSDFAEKLTNISKNLTEFKLYQFHEDAKNPKPLFSNSIDLREELKKSSETYVSDVEDGKIRDNVIYIYTSGTTGLPKAAVINSLRFFMLTMGVYSMSTLTEDDIIYDPLPLYHSAGGILGVGQCFLNGLTVVIRKKFSATNFWKDCIRYKCTAAQYIGETCRYILASTKDDKEHNGHSVRIMYGNGFKPQIWTTFVETFNIKEVYEFYGATEGNSNLINIDSTPGAIGFVPRYAYFIYPVALVKCDSKTGEPIRNRDGYCISCKPHEQGVLLGKINPKKAFFSFSGYADRAATEKKILQNVFKKGDFYFNSGDILEYDDFGYFYFRDRAGDTFRWKGENVSTSEVEAVISNIIELRDAVVYGVEVPHSEGRAGMVAIVDIDDSLNINDLASGLKSHLPTYAIPVFLRVMHSVPTTGTFKLKKKELTEEGYDLDKVSDKLYFYNLKEGKYVPLTKELYEIIKDGKAKL